MSVKDKLNLLFTGYDSSGYNKNGYDRYGYDKGSYSEGEVAKLEDWTPEEILKRGLRLLEFIENRWNLKFPSEDYKISLLGLKFLFDGRPDVPEVEEIDYSSRDTFFKGEKGEMKVSEHLKKKDLYMIEYYFKMFERMHCDTTIYQKFRHSFCILLCRLY